jgi:hypothetical protein
MIAEYFMLSLHSKRPSLRVEAMRKISGKT